MNESNYNSKLVRIENEYSKLWVENNPEIFAKQFLNMVEQYPSSEWTWTMTSREGFFILRAEIKGRVVRQSWDL